MITYEKSGLQVRADIVQAHNVAWKRIARPGAWLNGATHVTIAAETGHAAQCALCKHRKEALSPYSLAGHHDSLGVLPDRIVEQIHRIVSDPGRLTRKWFDGVIASGTMIHPKDLEGDIDTEEEKALAKYWGGVLANIRRALSLVPEEAFAWFQLVETQYLPGKWMRDFSREFRAITHAQIELIAGRVSVRNQCFY